MGSQWKYNNKSLSCVLNVIPNSEYSSCKFQNLVHFQKYQQQIEKIKQRINIIYKQIKKNEIQPKTGYLFNNLNSGNLEKTVAKLDIMNKLNGFIPRNN